MITPIDLIPSAGIRAALKSAGDTYAFKLGAYEHPEHSETPDRLMVLWALPDGEFALETNGDPIFEGESPDAFDDACDEYGIDLLEARRVVIEQAEGGA